jgi:heptosyltransferase III
MHTLIYHYGALGDFITTLPACAKCRQLFPGRVTLLGKSSHGNLARHSGYVDTVLEADSSRYRFLFLENQPTTSAGSFWEQFDTALLFAAADAPITLSAHRFFRGSLFHQTPLPPPGHHAVDYHLTFFSDSSALMEPPYPVLVAATPPLGSFFGSNTSAPYMVIHPGSGSVQKNWHFYHFVEVATLLRRNGYRIIWLSGPAEKDCLYPVTDEHHHDLPLKECVRLLANATAYLGNDSGITHLAAAAGTDVVALFGPSDPSVWAPRGSGTIRIMHHPPSHNCFPCHLQSPETAGCSRECITGITPTEVADMLLSLRRS